MNIQSIFVYSVLIFLAVKKSDAACVQKRSCQNGWTLNSNRCYFANTNLLNYDVARKACEELGATLMIIRNDAELTVAASYAAFLGYRFFIGATASTVGNFVWVDGTNVSLNDYWCANEPNNLNLQTQTLGGNETLYENCLEILPEINCLNDIPCSDQYMSICEKSPQ